jgi:hypothetical protein
MLYSNHVGYAPNQAELKRRSFIIFPIFFEENHSVKVDNDLFVDKLFGLHPYHLYGIYKLVFLSHS